MKKSILILLAGTTLLAGCKLAPKYERQAGAVPVALPQGGVYPAAPTDAQDVSRIGWRDFFLDDSLRQVIEPGIRKNRELRTAAANGLHEPAQYSVPRPNTLPTTKQQEARR